MRMPKLADSFRITRDMWSSPWMTAIGRFTALIAVFLFFAALVEDGKFYTPRNLENILRQSAVYATAALGMTMIIIAGGIDLSVGSMIALSVVTVAWILDYHYPVYGPNGREETVYLIHQWPVLLPWTALVAGVLVSVLAGFINGATVVGLRLVPFIVTLGTMGIFRGLAKGLAQEKDIYPREDTWLTRLMDPTLTSHDPRWRVWILPPGVWILIVSAVVAALILRYTKLGRYIFAIGSNEETARLCGVPVGRVKIATYTLGGLFAGLAGLMQFSFIGGIGQPTSAIAYELFVIAAVVIGGGSLMGGQGSILGSVIGALIITILYMGGQQMGWPKWVQEAVIGVIIIAAVVIDRLRQHSAT
ncbi:ABC transporter permease [Thermogutta sp.]|uniref:ABC transporter permease n=1 Tax=Thermogutta sp. TaxID=1962930 RepID=UPI003C7B43F0